MKRWLGHPLFIYASVRTWMSKYDRSEPHFQVTTSAMADDAVDGYFTIVLNTNPYTYLGNRPLDLSARQRRSTAAGRDHVPHVKVAADPPRARRRAARRRREAVASTSTCATDLSCLAVDHDAPFPYQLDGDYLGETLRAAVRAPAQRGEAGLPVTAV